MDGFELGVDGFEFGVDLNGLGLGAVWLDLDDWVESGFVWMELGVISGMEEALCRLDVLSFP